MASPTTDFYAAASGQAVAGGRYRLPLWRRSMAAGTWSQIGSNKISDINPELNASINPNYPNNAPWHAVSGQNGLFNWAGGAFDGDNLLFCCWGGGHTDYAGNEVYSINLRYDSPAWSLAINPTGAIGNTGTLDDSLESGDVYFDGRPRSQHTYGNLVFVGGKMYALPGGAQYKSGDGARRVFRFDPHTSSWATLANAGSPYSTTLYGGSADYDQTRNVIWSAGYNKVVKYDIAANTYTSPSSLGGISGGEFQCKYNAAHDLLVIFRHATDALLYDPTANTLTTMPVSGTAPIFSWGHAGMAWDAVNGYYLLWDGGADFATLTPPASSPKTNSWVWGTLTADAANTLTPSAVTDGTWGRFFIVPEYRVVCVQNAVNQKLYAFALE